ncbi:MAG: hypothetical protein JOY65_11665 [Acetobacteraceae bacterium]|nr:hypothetical protein [Acetobacteraceae bacterium]
MENLNARLRTCFTLPRHLGGSYLALLRFFLNHRRFPRSRHAERRGKSPRELMTGQGHPHLRRLIQDHPGRINKRRSATHATTSRAIGSRTHNAPHWVFVPIETPNGETLFFGPPAGP